MEYGNEEEERKKGHPNQGLQISAPDGRLLSANVIAEA